jgi:excinuclease ABC subunit C
MNAHAAALEFEAASRIRDKIRAVTSVSDANKVVDFEPESRDFVAWVFEGSRGVFTVLQMRGGKLVAKDLFHVRHAGEVSEAIPVFLAQYYDRAPSRPEKILLCDPGLVESVQGLLSVKYEPPLVFMAASSPREQSVLNMASENAKMEMLRRQNLDRKKEALVELKKILGLSAIPRRIEGFDIAHLGGQMTVASMVSFLFGRPDKAEYRHFHVKTLGGKIDDFESMREVTARRYTRLVNEKKPLPDLILIDGGIGQLNAVTEVLDALGIKNLPIASLAKKEEELYVPGKSEPLVLDRRSGALKILQAVRDESHRFATKFNKSLRKNKLSFEILEKVDGIGEKTSEALMKEYKSLEAILAAPEEDLKKKFRIRATAIPGLRQALSEYLDRTSKH